MKKVADFLALVCAVLGGAALLLQWTSTPSESMAGTYVGLAFGVLGLPTTYFWFYADHKAHLAKQMPPGTSVVSDDVQGEGRER